MDSFNTALLATMIGAGLIGGAAEASTSVAYKTFDFSELNESLLTKYCNSWSSSWCFYARPFSIEYSDYYFLSDGDDYIKNPYVVVYDDVGGTKFRAKSNLKFDLVSADISATSFVKKMNPAYFTGEEFQEETAERLLPLVPGHRDVVRL